MKSGIIIRIRNSRYFKLVTIVCIVNIIFSLKTYSLGDGPLQPEQVGFKQIAPGENVNLATGELTYTIPLFEIGPYFISLNYSGNISMEDEASWVGWGWNLSTGSIVRNVNGLPDDFNGTGIKEWRNQRDNITMGVKLGAGTEFFTLGQLTGARQLVYNNINGFSLGNQMNINFIHNNTTQWGSIGFSTGPNGLTISPAFSFYKKIDNSKSLTGPFIGLSFNSLKGIQNINFRWKYFGKNLINNELSIMPVSNFPYKTISFGAEGQLGSTLFGLDLDLITGLNYSRQSLVCKEKELPSYGFFYMYGKTGANGELLDFAREKDNGYVAGMPYLPQTFLQADLFNINSSIINESVRAYHNGDVIVSDPAVVNLSEQTSADVGLEFGMGNAIDIGGNLQVNHTNSYSKPWSIGISAYSQYTNPAQVSLLFSKYYPFKNIYFKSVSSLSASNITLNNQQANITNQNSFNYSVAIPANFTKYSTRYEIREDIEFMPIRVREIKMHPLFNNRYSSYISDELLDYQIGGIKVKKDGYTLLFNCPVVNNIQREVSFNVEGGYDENIQSPRLIAYTAEDASVNNTKGRLHHFWKREIPAYASSFLLTEVFDPEYEDLTGDGPTPDDPGDYAVFDYEKKISRYKWRIPYTKEEYKAAYNPNSAILHSGWADDIASYTYGEKDIWYLKEIRSKHKIAKFFISPRNDAHEAKSEHGGIGERSYYKLDSIYVFNVHDYYHKINAGGTIEPVQRIYFRYDYSLCRKVYNNPTGGGKLTLIEVIIVNRTNIEKRQRYVFEYSNINPDYDPDRLDRWGNYNTSNYNRSIFPYTTSADSDNSEMWKLKKIHTPEGGLIEIEYENGDYSYVQNHKATQMFKLTSVEELNNLNQETYKIKFLTDIPVTIPYNEATIEFNKYFNDTIKKNLYFKVLINTLGDKTAKDFVFGFANIKGFNLLNESNGNYYIGQIEITGIRYNNSGNKMHPFSYCAINSALINYPSQAFGYTTFQNMPETFQDVLNFIVSQVVNNNLINQLINMIQGPYDVLYNKGVGQYIEIDKSFIRLLSRVAKKGGAARVKRIRYINNWEQQTGNQEEGDYMEIEYIYRDSLGYSTGVASYEPQIGGDENPMKLPYEYTPQTSGATWVNRINKYLIPSPQYMGLKPVCESVFPAPVIYYSKVTEVHRGTGGITNGITVTEYYTTKDSPTGVYTTPIKLATPHFNLYALFFNIERQHIVAVQTFKVIVSDLPGKVKRITEYDGNGSQIRKVAYKYANRLKYYTRENCVVTRNSGTEKDGVIDLREEYATTSGGNVMANFTAFLLLIFPVPVTLTPIWVNTSYSEDVSRTGVYTQVLYNKYVLKQQIIEDMGARLDVNNHTFSIVNSQPILFSSKNRWNSKTYTFKLPGYYIYSQMSSGSPFTGNLIKIKTTSGGKILSTDNYNHFKDGDVLIYKDNTDSTYKFGWVYKTGSEKYLIDKEGNVITSLPEHECILWASGYRGMLNAVAYSVVSRKPPDGLVLPFNSSHRILSAKASTFIDYYSYNCDSCFCSKINFSDQFQKTKLILLTPDLGYYIKVKILYSVSKNCNSTVYTIQFIKSAEYGVYYDHQYFSMEDISDNINIFYNGTPVSNNFSVSQNGNYNFTVYFNNYYIGDFNIVLNTNVNSYILTSSDVVNPYIYKLRNRWRPYKSYIYLTNRLPDTTSVDIDLRNQGHYSTFIDFWEYDGNGVWQKNVTQWTLEEAILHYDLSGNPIHSYTIDTIFQAASFAHKNKFQEFIVYNSNYYETGFDGFEDYLTFYNASDYPYNLHAISNVSKEHFRVASGVYLNKITPERAHSGYYSLKLAPGDIISKSYMVLAYVHSEPQDNIQTYPFEIKPYMCAGKFHLSPKKYLFSCWISGVDNIEEASSIFIAPFKNIEYFSPNIEGWRLVVFSFDLSSFQSECKREIEIKITNTLNHSIFIDDIRIQPYNAIMKSFVYDPFNLRLIDMFDENSYMLRTQYDEQNTVQNYIKESYRGKLFFKYFKKHLYEK